MHNDRRKRGWSDADLGLPPYATRPKVDVVVICDWDAFDAELDAFLALEATLPTGKVRTHALNRYERWCTDVAVTPFEHDSVLLAALVAWLFEIVNGRTRYAWSSVIGTLSAVGCEWKHRHGFDPRYTPVIEDACRAARRTPVPEHDTTPDSRRGPTRPVPLDVLRTVCATPPEPPADIVRRRAAWVVASHASYQAVGARTTIDTDGATAVVRGHDGTTTTIVAASGHVPGHAPWVCPVVALQDAVAVFGPTPFARDWTTRTRGALRTTILRRFEAHGAIDVTATPPSAPDTERGLTAVHRAHVEWLRHRAAVLTAMHGRLTALQLHTLIVGDNAIRTDQGWSLRCGSGRGGNFSDRQTIGLSPSNDPTMCAVAALDDWVRVAGLADGDQLFCLVASGRIDRRATPSAHAENAAFVRMLDRCGADRNGVTFKSLRVTHDCVVGENANAISVNQKRTFVPTGPIVNLGVQP